MPHATFASEYYSIAKKVGDRRLRQIFLDLALAHIDVTLRDQESDGGLAIRGSINWQLGRPDAAIADYERMVTLKEDAGATARDIGWAKAELGFALVHSRSTRSRGMNLLEEGVSSFTGKPDGFFIRAKRKLALGYLKTGSPRRALAELVEAHDLAANASLYDQIGKVEHAAKLVDRMLPFLKNAY